MKQSMKKHRFSLQNQRKIIYIIVYKIKTNRCSRAKLHYLTCKIHYFQCKIHQFEWKIDSFSPTGGASRASTA